VYPRTLIADAQSSRLSRDAREESLCQKLPLQMDALRFWQAVGDMQGRGGACALNMTAVRSRYSTCALAVSVRGCRQAVRL
jgi:hypothetical protein